MVIKAYLVTAEEKQSQYIYLLNIISSSGINPSGITSIYSGIAHYNTYCYCKIFTFGLELF